MEFANDYVKGWYEAKNRIQRGKEIHIRVVSQCISPDYCSGWNDAIKDYNKSKNNA